MKKHRFIVVALILAMILCGCGGGGLSGQLQHSDSTAPQLEYEDVTGPDESRSDRQGTMDFDGPELSNESCRIKVTGLDLSNPDRMLVRLELENLCDNISLRFSSPYVVTDGFVAHSYFGSDLLPGKKAVTKLEFYLDEFTAQYLDELTDIRIYFQVYNADDYSADYLLDSDMDIFPMGEEYAQELVRADEEGDYIFRDDENIKMLADQYLTADDNFITVLYLENKTGYETMFAIDDAYLNDMAADPFFARSLPPYSCALVPVTWYKDTLSELGISEVEKVELILSAYNNYDWSAPSYMDEEHFELLT